jgi:hypothetical protein
VLLVLPFMKLDLVYDLLEFGYWFMVISIFLASSLILTANYLGISLSHNYLSRKHLVRLKVLLFIIMGLI